MTLLSQFKGIEIFFEFLLKSSLILVLTLSFYFLAKKKSASFRHFLLSTSFIILLALPFLILFAPGWQSGIIPSFTAFPQANSALRDSIIDKRLVRLDEASSPATAISPDPVKDEHSPLLLFLQDLYPNSLIALWFCGLFFLLIRLVFGLYGTFKITNQGVLINGYPWKELFLLFIKKTALKRKVRLLKNERVIVPMTWGVRKPVIIMPAQAANWPVEQCSTVLFHELFHVKRWDFLIRLLSRLTCFLYWFNPLGWIVFRQLKKEQEKACDEMVLNAGIKPSTYASCLLRMRKSIERKKGHYVPVPAIGMAGQSEFKERLTTILKKQLIPKEEKMKTKITLLILGIFVAALIGTAKPAKAQLPSDNDEAAITQTTDTIQKAVPVDEEKEKKKEKKEKKEKQKAEKKKEKKEHVWVSVDVDEEGEKEKKGKKYSKAVFLPHDSDITKIKVEGDQVFIYEKDKPVKKIDLKSKDGKDITLSLKGDKIISFIREGEECKDKDIHVFVGKEAKKLDIEKLKKIGKNVSVVIDEEGKEGIWVGKDDGKKFHIIKKVSKGKDKDIHLVLGEGKLAKIGERGVWVIKEGEDEEGKRVLTLKKGKDCHWDAIPYKIKTKIHEDKELKKSMEELKKGLSSIDKELKVKSADQEKALKDMEKALKKMEEELAAKHKKVEVIMEGPDEKLVEIAEDDKKNIAVVKKLKKGDLIISKVSSEGVDFSITLISTEKIGKKEQDQIKKAVAKLEKKLPKSYKIESEITETMQKVTVSSAGDLDKETKKKAFKDIEKFSDEFKNIIVGEDEESKDKIIKKIRIKTKEKKK